MLHCTFYPWKSNMETLITLKRLVSTTENGEIKYLNEYDGMTFNAIAKENVTTISSMLAGKYEIVVSNNTLDLDTITIVNAKNMSITKENGKYYIIITPIDSNTSGTMTVKHIYNNHYGYIFFSNKYSLYKK